MYSGKWALKILKEFFFLHPRAENFLWKCWAGYHGKNETPPLSEYQETLETMLRIMVQMDKHEIFKLLWEDFKGCEKAWEDTLDEAKIQLFTRRYGFILFKRWNQNHLTFD